MAFLLRWNILLAFVTLLEHLNKENSTLPILEKQFAEVQKNIDNMLNAIQQGIFTTSTKERLEALEREKSELSVQIIKEEMSKPKLTKEQILFWIYKFRKLNPKKLDHRRRLVNSFLNSVYLYDDKIIIDCNYREGTETITFEEIENSALSSDLTSLGAPNLNRNFDTKLRFCFFARKTFNNGIFTKRKVSE